MSSSASDSHHDHPVDTVASEMLSASLGGAFSSAVLYPLEVLKTRMQAEQRSHCHNNSNKKSKTCDGNDDDDDTDEESSPQKNMIQYARNLFQQEGIGVFYDGIQIAALLSALEKACYFCAYTALKQMYGSIRMSQTNNQNQAQSAPSPAKISAFANLILGCLAEWCHLPMTLPLDALITTIQTTTSSQQKKQPHPPSQHPSQQQLPVTTTTPHHNHASILAVWMTLWKEKSFYKGIQAYFILCFKPAIQYTIFEYCKAWILKLRQHPQNQRRQGTAVCPRMIHHHHQQQQQQQHQLSAGEAFGLGMFSRMIATLIVFPFVRAKVRLLSQHEQDEGDNELPQSDITAASSRSSNDSSTQCTSVGVQKTNNKSNNNIWKMLTQTYKEDGFTALYQGLSPEITRGVLSAAIMMMVKERINIGVKQLLKRNPKINMTNKE